ncbi:MAG: UrcA family protein [Croceibacterium sp.]
MKRSMILGAALAGALSSGAANAGERSERVSYRDLDLASVEGQAELQQRLDSAARRVCRFADDGQIVTAVEENACYREARQSVDVQVAQLTAEIQRGG